MHILYYARACVRTVIRDVRGAIYTHTHARPLLWGWREKGMVTIGTLLDYYKRISYEIIGVLTL